MSMVLLLQQAPDETIARLHAEPELITEFIEAGLPPMPTKPGFFGRLLGKKPEPGTPTEMPSGLEKFGEECDLDKAWHGLHFLFTLTDWEGDPPAGFLLNMGTEVGKVDVGYGPARTLTSVSTREIADFLATTDEAMLRSRFNPARMMELDIYPSIWDRDPADDDTLGYLMEYYRTLRDYVTDAANRDAGLVVWMC